MLLHRDLTDRLFGIGYKQVPHCLLLFAAPQGTSLIRLNADVFVRLICCRYKYTWKEYKEKSENAESVFKNRIINWKRRNGKT